MNNSNTRNRNQNPNRTSGRNSSSRNATGKNTASKNSAGRNVAGTSTASRNPARSAGYKNASRNISDNSSRGTNRPSNQSTNRSRVYRSKRRKKSSIFIKLLIVMLEAIQIINERIKERLQNATFNDKVVYALIILLLVLFGGSMFSVLGQKSTIIDVTQDFNAGAKTYTGIQQQSANQSANQSGTNNYTTQFANTCFIGDARVESLAGSVQLPSTTFLTQGDLRIKDATANSTVVSGLQAKSFGRIYIELGINDVASYSESEMVAGYTNLVNLVRNYQPDAKIYLLSVIPVTKQFNDANGNIILTTIEKINTNIQQVANKNNVNYVDIVPDICGTTDRILPATATADGKLLNQQYCNKWLAALSK